MRTPQRKRRNPFRDDDDDSGGTPSLIKVMPSKRFLPMIRENPNPPTDPRYRPVWEAAMIQSAKNWPDDPTYEAFRFRARSGDDWGKDDD
jgi:hypothetical protein